MAEGPEVRSRTTLRDDGYQQTSAVFSAAEATQLLLTLPSVIRGGARSLLELASVRQTVETLRTRGVVGREFRAVRALLFDKTPEANWALQWHQDTSIAVRQRHEVEGFGPWTRKNGVPHAIAPASLLAEMINVRVHLDPCGVDAGPLRVIRASHLLGRLETAAIERHRAEGEEVVCTAATGDVFAFRPLLLHASASSHAPHRRVLQLEFSRDALPEPLAWCWHV